MKKQIKKISGFSKLTKDAKVEWLINNYFDKPEEALAMLKSYIHPSSKIQKLHDELIENTVSNYYMPFGIAPNFLINDKLYCTYGHRRKLRCSCHGKGSKFLVRQGWVQS